MFKFFLGTLLVALLVIVGIRINSTDFSNRPKIAIVDVAGVITQSDNVVRQLSTYRLDNSVRGVILRIDSPGGAVAPSQEIYDEVMKLRDANKLVYASMGNLAASGGYYVASATHRIIANPGSLTGSIGVIMAFSNVEELIQKIGVRPEVIKSGEFKDSGSPVRPMTDTERKYLDRVVKDVHAQFVDAIVQARGMPEDKVRELADGRIFTGRQALKLNLVDELGGLEHTIEVLSKELGIEETPRIIREEEKTGFLDFLAQTLSPSRALQAVTRPAPPSLQYLWTLN
ncbi:MAG: signal peptide peptidase SppA [Candidatus Nitrohelix vancouverensis]|uniref:Signal peptide peptidase SppA n=1 Tax=Candidatus Nitrohelix vancouverensis TaxID=2705534 RepID=A0A7T0C0X3_9BACT|nr:MAG: signal peptide peptidase SppA [Candidatus Nitrohelix vancouverensis]